MEAMRPGTGLTGAPKGCCAAAYETGWAGTEDTEDRAISSAQGARSSHGTGIGDTLAGELGLRVGRGHGDRAHSSSTPTRRAWTPMPP